MMYCTVCEWTNRSSGRVESERGAIRHYVETGHRVDAAIESRTTPDDPDGTDPETHTARRYNP